MKILLRGKNGNTMRKTTIIMTICGWLLAGGAVAVAGAGELHVFNVLNYGAVGDDQTDNIEAFTACLKAVVAAAGGRMYLPAGVYRGGIVIPAVSKPIPSWITVEIVGESQPTPVFGTIGSFPLLKNGTIVEPRSVQKAISYQFLFNAVDALRPEFDCYGQTHIHSPNIDHLAAP